MQNNEELSIAKAKAEETDQLKTAFLHNMSYEIRSPMNAIMGFSELLIENYYNQEKVKRYTQIISLRCSDLLDIAKIESGQLEVHWEICNLNELFAELTSFFYAYQKRISKQHINFKLTTECTEIKTDIGKLRQILINIISNAFKYTNEGSIEGGCKFDCNNNLQFYISDTGIGIANNKINVIFGQFIQIEQGSSSGTGLGLTIVKGLLDLLHSEIEVESKIGNGSLFSFTIGNLISKKNLNG